MHHSQQLIKLFHECLGQHYKTRLCAGADEPLYEPAKDGVPANIYFRNDYFSSALHEIAHWCIAGEERRRQTDYGYWYVSDGRNNAQQIDFYRVEIKPQALEWCFSVACGVPFSVSVDNVQTSCTDWSAMERQQQQVNLFTRNCYTQVSNWLQDIETLPERGSQFISTLLTHYRPGCQLILDDFEVAQK